MKFLSSFDTDLDKRVYQENVEKYGKDKIMLIYRDAIYYYFYVVLPLIGYFILVILGLLLVLWLDLEDFQGFLWAIYSLFLVISAFFVGYKALWKYINYRMDFTIVTPERIISYDQAGFFSLKSQSVEAKKIKTITIDKSGLLRSIFNFGSIIFLSEGDADGRGDIRLVYLNNPEKLRGEIKGIIDLYRTLHKTE